jgi:uncharacterized protein (TIGR03546 family)
MLVLVKLIQSIFKALHSEGTPGQVAAGIALGAILGLTPLINLHNAVVFGLIIILNVSFPGAMLGWAFFTPIGFLLDPVFDAVGHALLLDVAVFRPLWTQLFNVPVLPLTNLDNTVVLGSFVSALALFAPIYVGARAGVHRYRDTIGARIKASRIYKAVTASKAYNLYRLFRPED